MLLMGFTLPECARQMGCAVWTARMHARKPEFLVKLQEHSGEIAKRLVAELSTNQIEMAQKLEAASAAALEEMMALMGESSGTLKFKVCQDILDRDPKSSRTKRMDLTSNVSHEFINPAVLIHAAATAKELETFQARKEALPDGNGTSDHHADSGNGQG